MFTTNRVLSVLPWVVLLGVCSAPLAAQQFEQTGNLYFSMVKGGASPLPQVLPVAPASGGNFYFSAVASTSSGGNWLAVTSDTLETPSSLLVSINDTVASTLAAGSYAGQIVVTANGPVTETVAVTLTVVAASTPSFANLSGGLTFAATSGGNAGSQVIQINNAGSGTLSWTLGASTFNGANFLTVSATSGTAPSLVTVGVAPANLPGGGTTTGVFIAQIVLTSSAGSVTIPVTVSVGVLSFVQSAPLSFSMPSGGAAPLPQVVPGASTTSSNFYFDGAAYTGTGGNWLTVSSASATLETPDSSQVVVNQTVASTLPAGVYTGEVVITGHNTGYAPAMVIPVTLTISPTSAAFFDNLPGGMNFFLPANGANPGSQTLQIRNAGSGTLNWTAVTSTADGGKWLSVSQSNGSAPSLVTVQVASQFLPGGAAAGTYSGNILFESAGSTVSVPITVSVGDLAFLPVSPLSAVMPLHGSAPVVQVANVASTTTSNFYFDTAVYTATGGNWLTASTASGTFETPNDVEIGFNETVVSTLPAGSYTGEVVVLDHNTGYAVSMTIPVTLTVAPASEAFFNDFPGGLQFSLAANGANPGSQVVQVGNAGTGTLNWTVTASTSDGGNWLTVSPNSGTAPGLVTVGVVSQYLPGGAAAGIYNGTLLFVSASGTASVPITVSVGVLGFAQVNPLSFNMPAGGSAPLPQAVSISTITSSNFYFDVSVSTSTGGNWLAVSPSGTLETPEGLAASINQNVASALPAGVYTGEVILTPHNTGYAAPLAVPVTLTVSPNSAPFFDNLPGGLEFALQANGGNPSSQVFQVRNAGSGTLNWTVVATTADGGSWLTVSASSGTAPSLVSVGVLSAKLPGGGAAGSYRGTLLFESGGTTVTVPITVSVGVIGFAQINPLSFTMPLNGSAPLPQEVAAAALTGSNFYFDLSTASATGGNWLTVSQSGSTLETTQYLTVSVNQAVASALPAGTYTAEIIMTPHNTGYTAEALTIPVSLTIAPPSAPFFDNVPGGLYFSAQTSSGNPVSQTISIRNAGTVGLLTWNAMPSTSDGGNWLTVSSFSGTAPSSLTIGVLAQNLPGQSATAGTFTGQVLLESANGSVTIPVSVNIGNSAFVQSNGLVFNVPPGSNSQTLNIVEIGGGGPDLTASSFTGNGGNWLSISPSGSTSAPRVFTVTVNTSGLVPGVYTGEALFVPTNGTAGQTVQVTLNFGPPPASITASGGTPQSAVVETAFTSRLVATLKDASNNPVAGVTVTFTVPGGGASGTFAGGVNTAVTNAQGQATSPVFTANDTMGGYTVTATGAGLTTSYSLTNLPPILKSIAVTPVSPSIVSGTTQQFTATGTYSDGSTKNITTSATWASGTTAVATITTAGLATGLAAGTSSITASLSGVTSAADLLTVTSSMPPTVVSLSPNSGSGLTQTFTGVYSDPNGAADLNTVSILFNTAISGVNACWVRYYPAANLLYLENNTDNGLTAGIAPGSASQVSNSQCTLNGTGSSYSVSGNNATLSVALTFSGTFTGQKNAYLAATETNASTSGWVLKGTWTPVTLGPPTVTSLSPSSGSGLTQTFTGVYSDPNGAADLNTVSILFNTAISGVNACWVRYYPAANLLYLENNTDNGLTAGIAPGSASQVSNSQCTLKGTGSSYGVSGNNATLSVALTFSGTFTGQKNVYLAATENNASTSGWVLKGTWTPVTLGPPTVTSLSPSAGSGLTQTFTGVFSDPNGAADLNTVSILFNTAISGVNACWVRYYPASNLLYLENNTDNGLTGGIAPGSASQVSNSQCTLSGTGSSYSVSGNNATLSVALTFSGTFTAQKNAYLAATENNASTSGWVLKGSWTP